MPEIHTSPLAYSINEAIAVSSIKRTKMYELINAKKIQIVKVGSRTLVKADSLHKLIDTGG